MLKNYFITAWRNIERNKLFAFINLIGLAVGIAAVLLIGLYVQNECNYDSFHKNKSTLYRVGFEYSNSVKSSGTTPIFTAPFGPAAKTAFPEILSFCRVSEPHKMFMTKGENKIKSSNICFADSSFFQLFSFTLHSGNTDIVLKQPFSIVLTTPLAEKLFGNKDAVGKIIQIDGKDDYTVTGIADPPPGNSQFSYEALISFSTLYKDTAHYFMSWNGGNQYIAYLQLTKNANVASLEKKFESFLYKNIPDYYRKSGNKITASLQPIQDVHLKYEDDSESIRTRLYIFGIVSILILIISCVNYINLTTAQASSRFKEIGVRKVLGALRYQLIKQFLGESMLLTLFAFLLSILLVYAIIPVYTQIIGKSMLLLPGSLLFLVSLIFLLILIIGAGAGSYLAFYLSSLNAYKTLKAAAIKNKHSGLKKGLIVAQFAITTALMTCTLIVNLQMRYIKNKPLGFDKEHILALPLTGDKTKNAADYLKQQIEGLADVETVSAVSEIPHDGITMNGFLPEGSNKFMTFHQLDADENLMKTFRFNMIEGNYFSNDHPADADGFIINETLAKKMGWNRPIGKTITRDGTHKVIGVVQDFIFSSLREKTGPLIITNHPWQNKFDYLAIRYRSNNPSDLLAHIKNIWQHKITDAPFDYWFLDDAYNNLYKEDERFQQVFLYFSVISILLSLAGIFGLVTLTIQQGTKEIGIRKVLGAGIFDIIKMTTGSFFALIVTASVIAVPVTWYYMNNWLQDFAYRIHLSWWMFVIAGVVTAIIALIIISIQSYFAARVNPVKSLRTE